MRYLSKPHSLALCALALLAASASSGCSSSTSKSGPEVRVSKPSHSDLVASFVASGRVQARVVKLAPGEHGRLLSLNVKLGDRVHKGQILARIDDSEARQRLRVMEADLQAAIHKRGEAEASLQAKRTEQQIDVSRAEAGRGEAQSRYREVAAGGDSVDIVRARANYNGAQDRYMQAQRDLARQRELFKEDIVSTAQIERFQSQEKSAASARDEARAAYDKARQGARRETLSVAESQIRKADVEVTAAQSSGGELSVLEERLQQAAANVDKQQGELETARLSIKRMEVTSPCDGLVSSIFVEAGEMVGADIPILAVQRTDHMWVEAELDEQDSAQVKADEPVDVSFTTFPGKTFAGKVEEISPTLEQRANSPGDSKVLKIRVGFKDQVPDLRVGLHADVQGHSSVAPTSSNVLSVPNAAVLTQSGKNYVFTVDNNVAHKTPVTVGERTTDSTAIRQGLNADSMVVVEGADGLSDGATVRVRQ